MTETPQTPAPAPFSWAAFLGGLAMIIPGGLANIFCGAVAIDLPNSFFGFLLGAAPGAIMIIVGLLTRRGSPGFAAGILCGGCGVGLIGGICGANMVGTTFH